MADVIIIGAGMSGLSCALRLHAAGRSVLILEAEDAVGGRVRTDIVHGYRLDRGFQVYLTAYPECRDVLDYAPLQFKAFKPGALIWHHGRFHRFADPFRAPVDAISTALSPLITLGDKLRVAKLRVRTTAEIDEIFQRPETSTLDYLKERGFSEHMIERFFRPFFGGVFLEDKLATSSRMFEFLFKMFADGSTVVPALGMQQIPEQLASKLPHDSIRLNTPVRRVSENRVTMESGQELTANAIVLTTQMHLAPEILQAGDREQLAPQSTWNSTANVFYSCDRSPIDEPILLLNGENSGVVNSVAVMSDVSDAYAPAGRALISVSIIGTRSEVPDHELDKQVRAQMQMWFGPQVTKWEYLRTYRIRHALPSEPNVRQDGFDPRIRKGLYVSGDYRENASLNGAVRSGRKAAEAILVDLS